MVEPGSPQPNSLELMSGQLWKAAWEGLPSKGDQDCSRGREGKGWDTGEPRVGPEVGKAGQMSVLGRSLTGGLQLSLSRNLENRPLGHRGTWGRGQTGEQRVRRRDPGTPRAQLGTLAQTAQCPEHAADQREAGAAAWLCGLSVCSAP